MVNEPVSPRSAAANVPVDLDPAFLDKPLLPRQYLLSLARRGDWAGGMGPAVALLVTATALWQVRNLRPHELFERVPQTPAFWCVFLADYMLGPACDYLIFRRLWQVPPAAFAALVRKLVTNQLVASYVGETHFYAWARAHTDMVTAPFAAIKDVAMLSALAGNAVTLLLLLAVTPLLRGLPMGLDLHLLPWSGGFVMLTSSVILFLRKSLFSLPRADLVHVAAMQTGRVLIHVVLVALAWHLALPGQDVRLWLLLSAIAMLLSRLPLVPNSGLALAAIAAFLIGQEAQVTRLLAMMAVLTITTHIAIGLPLFAKEVLTWRR
jgi:hypothetical protein